jgi:putative FmdB family regulatory protein
MRLFKKEARVPTYEYLCTKCGQRFDLFQSMSAPPAESCPECGGPVERQIGAGAAILVRGGSRETRGQRAAACDRSTPCCGRDERCDAPPCGER